MVGWVRLLVAGSLLAASPAGAAIFGQDDRRPVTADQSIVQSMAIARFSTPLRWRKSTAFLVSPCHLVTSQHLVSMRRDPTGKRVKIQFAAGPVRKLWSTVVSAGHMERRISPADVSGDWILLRLDQCLPRNTPFLRLSRDRADDPRKLSVKYGPLASVGYPGDKRGLMLEPDCRIHGVRQSSLLHDCATFPGSSGSPVFTQPNSNCRSEVLAILASGWKSRNAEPFNMRRANLATPVNNVAKALENDLLQGAVLASR